MNELLNNINEHKDKNNMKICYALFNYIIDNNIVSIDELKKAEDKCFNTDDTIKRNEIKYKAFISDITHFDDLDMNDNASLCNYEKLYQESNSEEDKTKYLVLMYDLIGWEVIFPYTTYKLILLDRFN